MSELNTEIEQNGYANVPIGLTNTDLEETIATYQEFIDLGEEFHAATRYDVGERGDGDFGQFAKRAGEQNVRGTIQDNKDALHFGVSTRQVIESRLGTAMPGVMKWLIGYCEEVFWAAQRVKAAALDEIDTDNNGLKEVLSPEQEQLNDVLRLILYYDSGQDLAKAHFDRAVTTVAIGESHGGLRIASGNIDSEINQAYVDRLDSGLKPVSHMEGQAKFFLGAGWRCLPESLRKGCENLPLGWHDVIKSDTRVNDRVARWAIVLFNNPYVAYQDYQIPTPTQTRPYKAFMPPEAN